MLPVMRTLRPIADVGLGVLSGLAGILLLGFGWVLRRAAFRRYAAGLAAWEQRRLGLPPAVADERRAVAFLAARLGPALLGALVLGLLAVGVVLAAVVLVALVRGRLGWAGFGWQAVIGAALLLINVQAIVSVRDLDRQLATALLTGDDRERMRRRITELTVSRAGVIEAVDAERRRIERDLHDGVQQRLVALGMLLGRARRATDPDRAGALLAQAHDDAQRAIEDLREVAWRVYPSALEHSTLDEVLTMVAQRSGLRVHVTSAVSVRPPRPVETVLYFVACEAVTNAAKHAGAAEVRIALEAAGGRVSLLVRDDGRGGADPAGSGLNGLARRVTALDGTFTVDSPPGAGTGIRVELPCG